MPCQYNNIQAFDIERMYAYEEMIELRAELSRAKKKLNSRDKKIDKWFWSGEIQQIQEEMSLLESQMMPRIVK